ncbi:hypothetical protein BGX38DRAFT_753969 [Terfezia claveryi]|nr:hypothetical protein BGX38DRAFT_753969 [Terfezia claveryi]
MESLICFLCFLFHGLTVCLTDTVLECFRFIVFIHTCDTLLTHSLCKPLIVDGFGLRYFPLEAKSDHRAVWRTRCKWLISCFMEGSPVTSSLVLPVCPVSVVTNNKRGGISLAPSILPRSNSISVSS